MKRRVRELEEQRRRAAKGGGGAGDKQKHAEADLRRMREGQQDQQRRNMENVCACSVPILDFSPPISLLDSPPNITHFRTLSFLRVSQWARKTWRTCATQRRQRLSSPSEPETCVRLSVKTSDLPFTVLLSLLAVSY